MEFLHGQSRVGRTETKLFYTGVVGVGVRGITRTLYYCGWAWREKAFVRLALTPQFDANKGEKSVTSWPT